MDGQDDEEGRVLCFLITRGGRAHGCPREPTAWAKLEASFLTGAPIRSRALCFLTRAFSVKGPTCKGEARGGIRISDGCPHVTSPPPNFVTNRPSHEGVSSQMSLKNPHVCSRGRELSALCDRHD